MLVNAAAAAKDVAAYRVALEVKQRAERRGGAILGTMGKRAPVGRLGISNRSQRWREFAALSDERFEAKIAGLAHRYPSGVRRYRKKDQPTTGPVVTSITAWEVDEAGCMSRSLVAAGETPPNRPNPR